MVSRAEEIMNLSDSNHEGINSSCIRKKMNSLLGNHEHSEGSEVNMPEKCYVKSNVDGHQNISSEESRCSQLIKNHEVTEAGKGNRQESVVLEKISLQRKETIISSHRSAPMLTHDRVNTSVRFSDLNVVPLEKGMANMSVRNYEVNEGNENMVYKENVYTCQMEGMASLPVCSQNSSRIGSSNNDFDVGREFEDIEAFRNSLSNWAVRTGYEYRPVRKTPSLLVMKCVSEGCKWYIRVSKLPNLSAFRVGKYQSKHTCSGPERGFLVDNHKQATIKWIVSKMKSSIEKNPEIEPTKIVKEVRRKFNTTISYNKAVKAKTRVLEVMRNGLDPLDRLVRELEQNGVVVKVGFSSGSRYLFWAFQACIDALRNHLRPVVYVGSVGTQVGVLMYARCIDGNKFYADPIDVGFGFYDFIAANGKLSWETYLGWLKEFVLPPTTAAVADIPFSIVTEFERTAGLTRAVEKVLPHLHHFFNSYHLAIGFSKTFEGPKFNSLSYKACTTFSTMECEAALQEMKSLNKEAYEKWLSSGGSKSHWAIAFSPNKHAFAAGGLKWDRSNFSLIREDSSIGEIVETSRVAVANYFLERQIMGKEAARTAAGWAPGVMEDI